MKRPVWDDRLSTDCALGMIEMLLREGFVYGQVVRELAKLGEKAERGIQTGVIDDQTKPIDPMTPLVERTPTIPPQHD